MLGTIRHGTAEYSLAFFEEGGQTRLRPLRHDRSRGIRIGTDVLTALVVAILTNLTAMVRCGVVMRSGHRRSGSGGVVVTRDDVELGRRSMRLVIAQVVMTARGSWPVARHDRARHAEVVRAARAADRGGHRQATVRSWGCRVLLGIRVRHGGGDLVPMRWHVLLVFLKRDDAPTRLAGMDGVNEGGVFGVRGGGVRWRGEEEGVIDGGAHFPELGRVSMPRLRRRGGEVVGERVESTNGLRPSTYKG